MFVVCIVGAVFTAVAPPLLDCSSSGGSMQVTLEVFSSTENPVARLNDTECRAAQALLFSRGNCAKMRNCPLIGYTGFAIKQHNLEDVCVNDNQALERFLLSRFVNISSVVKNHTHLRIESGSSGCSGVTIKEKLPSNEAPTNCHVAPIFNLDPDAPPSYDPAKDCHGCFAQNYSRKKNNCYDYGNDIVTNTFAQPGRGSGTKWASDNCTSVGAAAVRDGLKLVGTDLPTNDTPEGGGHYVALFIWPRINFHW